MYEGVLNIFRYVFEIEKNWFLLEWRTPLKSPNIWQFVMIIQKRKYFEVSKISPPILKRVLTMLSRWSGAILIIIFQKWVRLKSYIDFLFKIFFFQYSIQIIKIYFENHSRSFSIIFRGQRQNKMNSIFFKNQNPSATF